MLDHAVSGRVVAFHSNATHPESARSGADLRMHVRDRDADEDAEFDAATFP